MFVTDDFLFVTHCNKPSFPSILDPQLRSSHRLPCRYAQKQKEWRRHAALATLFLLVQLLCLPYKVW